MIDQAQAYRRNPDLFAADVGGERVMMSIERGEYFGLGGVGGRIYDLLEQPRSLVQLAATIADEYAVEPAICRADIENFLGQMLSRGLIVPA